MFKIFPELIRYLFVLIVSSGFFVSYADDAAKTLKNLINYEIDYSFLLSQSMDNIKNTDTKENIRKMKEECEENIKNLSILIQKNNGEVPAYGKDFKGFIMEGYAAMRGSLTEQGALKALHTNQKLILKAFESSLNSTLPEDVKGKIKEISEKKKGEIISIEKQIS